MFTAAAERLSVESPSLSALVTIVDGRIVDEYYADGFAQDDITDIWSSTKSITSAAVGIAIGDGLFGLDDRLGDLIPDRIPDDADLGTAEIRVRDLLTMTSGWEWDGTLDYANLGTTDDYAGRALSLPIIAAPGEYFTTTPATPKSCRSSSRPSPGRRCATSRRNGCSRRSESRWRTGWRRRRVRRPAAGACS